MKYITERNVGDFLIGVALTLVASAGLMAYLGKYLMAAGLLLVACSNGFIGYTKRNEADSSD